MGAPFSLCAPPSPNAKLATGRQTLGSQGLGPASATEEKRKRSAREPRSIESEKAKGSHAGLQWRRSGPFAGGRTSQSPCAGGGPAAPLSQARKWLFSVVGFVVLPLLLLAGAEVALRLAGYGYPTAFFKRIRIGNEDYFVDNDKFGLRFFPPELARSPAPVVMKANKGPGVRRIFLLGESAALGDPRPAYGPGRCLQALLRERLPDTQFEVICGAVTAINSHALLPIARECARRQGDLWILYMGNNEMVGPFGATTVFGSQSPPLWNARLGLAIQQTRLGQLLMALARALAGSGNHPPSWGGMQMFMESRIAPRDPRKQVVYSNFRRNLQDILQTGRSKGVPIVLCTVAVNLKDCPPFASLQDPALNQTGRLAYDALCAKAGHAAQAGDFSAAAAKYEQAARIDAGSAELHYLWGQCLLQLSTQLHSARAHLEVARDNDALPFRADSRLNAIIAQAARRWAGPGLVFCDAAQLLATNSPAGVPGREAFYEHVHFNPQGNYLLGRAWAQEVLRLLPASATNHAGAAWASQEVCEQRLGLTDWNRCAILEDLLQRLSQPPFTGQLDHTQQIEQIRGQLQALRLRLDGPAADRARQTYLAALKLDPDDHRLHENFAQFLEAVGNLPEAVAEWQRVRQLIPQHHAAYFQAGRLLVRQGKIQPGRALLSQAVTLRPDLAEGWLELGNLCALERRPELALKDYERLRQLAPHDPRAYYHIGKALSRLQLQPEAILNLQHAIQLRPDYWEAHYALGEELAFSGQTPEAQKEFEETLRLKPGYAMAHLNLGVALAKQRDLENARRHLEEAARLDPHNPEARDYLRKLQAANPPH